MLIDGRAVLDGSVVTADVCVIGSGAAGITVARELAGSTLDVVVLESGAFELDTRTQNLYKGKFVGQPVNAVLEATRMRYFGGTTNHWAGNCHPLDPADFESKPYVERSGWPFSYEDLEPYYLRAADTCQIGPFRFDWQFGVEKGAQAPPELESDTFHGIARQITEARFGEVYRSTLVDSASVRVFLWSNVIELLTAPDDARRIDAVQVATLGGPKFQVKASAFVLATGGIEVPRVLLASNSRVPKGIGNSHDLVGRCFADHPNVLMSLALLRADAPYHTAKTTFVDSAGVQHPGAVSMWLGLRRRALRANELLSAQISSIEPSIAKAIGVTPSKWPELFARRAQIDDAALDFAVGSNMHHMGTARMHRSPRQGVVDENCRVHDVKNLYIGGSAVFPSTGASPPTMTIVALATRLADHLRTKVLAA